MTIIYRYLIPVTPARSAAAEADIAGTASGPPLWRPFQRLRAAALRFRSGKLVVFLVVFIVFLASAHQSTLIGVVVDGF